MKILSIGSDRNLFVPGSAVRARVIEYGELCEEMHVVVFTTQQNFQFSIRSASWRMADNFQKKFNPLRQLADGGQISNNVWIYPTYSRSKFLYIFDAVRISKQIIENCKSARTNVQSDELKIENSHHEWLTTCQDPFESGLVGWLIKHSLHIPLQLQIHTDFLSAYFWHESLLNKLRVLTAKFLIPRADCMRVVSERIKNSLKIGNFKLKIKPTVLPIYSDSSRFMFGTPGRINLHTKYPQYDFIILMVARLAREKNIGLAIDTMREIVKSHPKTGLILIGDGSERVILETKIKNQGLENNVVFEGTRDGSVLPDYYHTANAFLLTSNYEGYGLALIEAALSGCPIVTTDVGIAGELFRDGKEAFICPVGDAECLTKRMRETIESATLREQFTRNAREAAEKTVVTKDEYLRLYKKSWEQCFH